MVDGTPALRLPQAVYFGNALLHSPSRHGLSPRRSTRLRAQLSSRSAVHQTLGLCAGPPKRTACQWRQASSLCSLKAAQSPIYARFPVLVPHRQRSDPCPALHLTPMVRGSGRQLFPPSGRFFHFRPSRFLNTLEGSVIPFATSSTTRWAIPAILFPHVLSPLFAAPAPLSANRVSRAHAIVVNREKQRGPALKEVR